MSRVFINYRRLDSAAYAGRVYDRLIHDLGRDFVFMDIDKIDPGDDWIEVIEQRLEACSAVIAIIGPAWLDCRDEAGERRLDNPDDHVRRELAVALQRKVRVVPLLVGGATMPRSDRLPPDLAPLVRRNAIELSDQRFHHDVDRLVEVLRRLALITEEAKPATDSPPHSIPTEDVLESTSTPAITPEPQLPASPRKAAPAVSGSPARFALNAGADLRAHQKPVMCVGYSPDGSLLASAGGGDFFGSDTAIRLWSLPKGKLLREIPGHKDQVTGVAFSPDGKTLAACSLDALRLWRVDDGKRLLTIEEDYGDTVEFSSDGALLLSGSVIFRFPDGELVRTLGDEEGCCYSLMPDSQHFAGMTGKRWQIGRIDDGKPVLNVPLKPEVEFPNIALSADGRLLAAGWHHSGKNWIALFDTAIGKRLWERDTDSGVNCLRFHPLGNLLAGSNRSGEEVVLWHLADGEVVARVKMPSLMLSFNEVHGLAFSTDGKQLAAACHDAVVRQWTVMFKQDTRNASG